MQRLFYVFFFASTKTWISDFFPLRCFLSTFFIFVCLFAFLCFCLVAFLCFLVFFVLFGAFCAFKIFLWKKKSLKCPNNFIYNTTLVLFVHSKSFSKKKKKEFKTGLITSFMLLFMPFFFFELIFTRLNISMTNHCILDLSGLP